MRGLDRYKSTRTLLPRRFECTTSSSVGRLGALHCARRLFPVRSLSLALARRPGYGWRAGIDNLQNYCLGTRYGARLRSRLCRRLSISLVRYRHGLEKFLEHHFIPIRRRFYPHDLPTDLLRGQDPFFFSGRRPIRLFDRKRRWRGMACSCAVVHHLSKAVSIFFF